MSDLKVHAIAGRLTRDRGRCTRLRTTHHVPARTRAQVRDSDADAEADFNR